MDPHFVAHHGLDSTTFYFADGSRLRVVGYCYWNRGRAVAMFRARDPR